jgi:hypothetical protein
MTPEIRREDERVFIAGRRSLLSHRCRVQKRDSISYGIRPAALPAAQKPLDNVSPELVLDVLCQRIFVGQAGGTDQDGEQSFLHFMLLAGITINIEDDIQVR